MTSVMGIKKKMKKTKSVAVIVLTSLIFYYGCKKEEDQPQPTPLGKYETGVLISNEGPFQTGSGSITYFDRLTNEIEGKIFEKVNGYKLGNIVQSIEYFNDRIFIVVNNSNKVEVVNSGTFESIATIENITSPRYFLAINDQKAYITSWANEVSVIDLTSYTIIKTIPTQTGPEKMTKIGNKVFVLNQGGFSVDSTITVIDTDSDNVFETIYVYPKPTGIQVDKNGKVWVMCSGKGWNGFPQTGDSEGHLLCINPDDYSIEKDIAFPTSTNHPDKLIFNGSVDRLFYIMPDGIYDFEIEADDLNNTPFLASNKMIYQIGIDPMEGYLYLSDPVDFAQNGWVFRYNQANGAVIDSIQAGVIPGGFLFRAPPTIAN